MAGIMNQNLPNNRNINLLENSIRQPKGKSIFKVSKFVIYFFVSLIIAFFFFSYQVLFTDTSLSESLGGKVNIFHQLTTMAKGGSELKADNGRVNVLLLGVGGEGHDGPNLTDTIIVASIELETNKIAMISIPRDLVVEIEDKGFWKINNANHFGEQKNPGHGGELVKNVVSQVIGVPIHYYIRVDFSGFEKLIDDLGGVKVEVDNSFIDYQFPAANYKYQVVSFDKGWQTMDGETALQFVRSRHGNNGEGSDFSRSKRQQKVITAVKERALSYRTLFSPGKLSKLLKAFGKHVSTDMEINEILELYKLSKLIDLNQTKNIVLDDSPGGYLVAGKMNEAYVLQPRSGNFGEIQFLAQNVFAGNPVLEAKSDITSTVLEIQNGTPTNGLAFNSSQKLKQLGFKVVKIGNAPTQDYTKTVMYKLTDKTIDQEVIETLETKLGAELIEQIPAWVREDAEITTDFYIILGEQNTGINQDTAE